MRDADRRNISVSKGVICIKVENNYLDRIDDFYIDQLVKKTGDDNDASEEEIKIQIAPCFIQPEDDPEKKTWNSRKIYPFWISAFVPLDGGELRVCDRKEDWTPVFVREVLSPNAEDDFTIGSLEVVDELLCNFEIDSTIDWRTYYGEVEKLFKKVTGKKFSELNDTREFVVRLASAQGMAVNIIRLYDSLLKYEGECTLLNTLVELDVKKGRMLSRDNNYLNYEHLGQMKNDFPLSVSQREALAMYTDPKCSDVFAVNGPPGTGKTTLLQTIVANQLVKNVIEYPDCPEIIVASSANNQAITNILNSFVMEKDDPLSNRWLPDLDTLGLYLSSSKGGNYKKMNSVFGGGFPEEYEDKERLDEYKNYFICRFNRYFSLEYNEMEHCQQFLYKEILALQKKTKQMLSVSDALRQVDGFLDVSEEYLHENKFDYVSGQLEQIENCLEKISDAEELLRELGYTNKLLSFFKNKKINEEEVIKQVLKIVGKEILEREYTDCRQVAIDLKQRKSDITKYKKLLTGWSDNKQFRGSYNNVLKRGREYRELPIVEDMAVRLDTSYRYQMFWYAVHYREVEFLKRLEERPEGKERAEEAYCNRLRRLACIMPVFISTFHSLPKFFVYSCNGDNFNPLYNEIDLLIVDEAGQVTPEIAVPSFALAKRAIVVGDIFQIEPIWSISDVYSEINLKECGVINTKNKKSPIAILEKNGFLSSSGSIMKLAQKSCNFVINKERGAFLAEHRRCLDPIAKYCNDYVYSGRLKLMVGCKPSPNVGLPPKGYVHVNGTSAAGRTGSRYNTAEAQAIAIWIMEKTADFEQKYGKPISKIIAVVTPFKAQELEIRKLLGKAYKDMIVGTVHALQGAESPIVVFSPVNSPGDRSFFMERDNKYNLLNVAVSRAKHSFLVFGNMNIFDQEKNTPVGNLAKWLFDSPENELSGNFIYEQPEPLAKYYNPTRRLSTLEEHRDVLGKAFREAKERLLIVSPFISIKAIKSDRIDEAIRECHERGVKVCIFTDDYLDFDFENKVLKKEACQGRKAIEDSGAELVELHGIHCKSIAIDHRVLVEGSFNWLSASRESNNNRYEASILLENKETSEYIDHLINDLERMRKKGKSSAEIKKKIVVKVKHSDGFGGWKKDDERLISLPKATEFFGKNLFNSYELDEINKIKEVVNSWKVFEDEAFSENVIKIRKKYPRYRESWLDEEKQLLQKMITRTNDLKLYVDCLKRNEISILFQVENLL